MRDHPMNWDAIGAVGEILGAIGVVASLFYVGQQVKEGSRATRGQTFESLSTALSTTANLFVEDPTLLDIGARSVAGEELSADWAERYLQGADAELRVVGRITNMIRATKSHVAEDPDTQLMLDIDLGILGQSRDVFEAYDRAIRKECARIPEEQYRSARADVLRGFLERTAIFHLDEFRDAFESQARRNIEDKLNEY
jgi:hypothetical protein